MERAADRSPCLQSAKGPNLREGSERRNAKHTLEEAKQGQSSVFRGRGCSRCGQIGHYKTTCPQKEQSEASSGEGSRKGAGKRTHTDTEADAAGPRKAPRGLPASMPGAPPRAAEGSTLGELAGGTGAASAARSGGRVEAAPLHARENDRGKGSEQGKGKEKAGGEEEVVAQVQTASLPPHQQQPPLP